MKQRTKDLWLVVGVPALVVLFALIAALVRAAAWWRVAFGDCGL